MVASESCANAGEWWSKSTSGAPSSRVSVMRRAAPLPSEVEDTLGVAVRDGVDLVLRAVTKVLGDHLGAVRVARVGVRVVALPQDLVDADVVAHLHADVLIDET